jgi:UDP-N-acetylglucosamine 2-epimerase
MAAALAAFYLHLPCAHVEAGLRSHDRRAPWPEEMNRRLTDQLCTRYYPPTEGARRNLIAEGIDSEAILITGQTGVDAALLISRQVQSAVPSELAGVVEEDGLRLIYATGHRRESFDGGIAGVAAALRAIIQERPDVRVVYPAHPNPNVLRQLSAVVGSHERLHIIRPVSYPCSVWLMSHASVIVSDSGGIQEEAPSFGVPVLVTRDVTERPEGVEAGFLRIVGTRTERVLEQLRAVLDDATLRERLGKTSNPYGDGLASRRIADDVVRLLSSSPAR